MPADPLLPAPVPAAWTAIGPSVMRNGQAVLRPPVSGRVPSIALSRYGEVIYAGTNTGGVWRSDDAGVSWRPLMDPPDGDPLRLSGRADSLAIGAVAIHPDQPDQVFVGTGEGFNGTAVAFGVGPIVSSDGGRTWTTEAVAGTALRSQGFYAIAVDPTDPERAIGATRIGLYRRGLVGVVQTWQQCALPFAAGPNRDNRDVSSVVCVRGVFFAAVRNGGPGLPASILRSNDTGITWTVVGQIAAAAFPAGTGRITLAVHPERIDVVYAVRANGDIWRIRINAAGTGRWRQVAWTPVPAGLGAFVGDQGWYDLAMVVDPGDVDTLYCGGSTVSVDVGNVVRIGETATSVWSSSIWRLRVRPQGNAFRAQPTFIGHNVHADVHTLVFPRGVPNQLWVGCDGGVFVTDTAQGPLPVFRSLNSGLATTLVGRLAQHPTQPAVLFAATQDNGGQRTVGDEAWSLTTEGDAGACVVDWNNPYRVLMTYTRSTILRCTDGGNGIPSWHYVSIPAAPGDLAEEDETAFYAPMAGAPKHLTTAHASRVAFGTHRLWLSDTFGSPNLPPAGTNPGDWRSLPNSNLADRLPNTITAIAFSKFGIIFVGTSAGGVYRYTQAVDPGPWVRTQIDTLGVMLPLVAAVTDIEPDPADGTGLSCYVVMGGRGDQRHVWYWNNVDWVTRSGVAGPTGLMDVHANALVVDPDNHTHLYVATDLGVFRSGDSGATWGAWGVGLPQVATTDLLIHAATPDTRIIRVATNGRSVFSRRLGAAGANPPATTPPVELYVRDHRLDLGLAPTVYAPTLTDPSNSALVLAPGVSPDIRCDAPDPAGAYQFPAGHQMSLVDFFQLATDDSATVPTAAQPVTTRVQVLVHNRGPRWAHDVQVAVLVAKGQHGTLPALPTGWAAHLRTGQPLKDANWLTVGFTTVSDLRPGHPQVATILLTSDLLPDAAAQPARTLLVALHHADDPLLTDELSAETVAASLRQVALRHLTVVPYTPIVAAGPTVPSRFLPIGPSPMLNGLAQGGPPVAGRTPGLAVSRHGDVVYAGTANGGVWRSDDAGGTWRSCMEAFDLDPAALRSDSLACPTVAIHPDRPERVFVGTGETYLVSQQTYFGVGMLASFDGGRNWLREPTVITARPVLPAILPAMTPVTESAVLVGQGCYALVVDPQDPERAIVASNAGCFLRQIDGIGAFHWRRLWFATTVNGAGNATAAVDIADITSVACAVAGGVSTFVAVLRSGQVYRCTSAEAEFIAGAPLWRPLGRATWPILIGGGYQPVAGARCTLAMKEDDATVVYLIRADGTAFRYDVGTDAWATITPMPTDLQVPPTTWDNGQGEYDLSLTVDPRNVNRIVLGGATVRATADALSPNGSGNWFSSIWDCTIAASGANWSLAPTYIGARAHADVHRLLFTPGDPTQLWTGCDGGVFRCDRWDQPGAFFIPRNRGLATLSGMSVDTHPREDAIVLLSTQDNGAALSTGTPGWRMVLQGDSGASIWNWADALNGASIRTLITYVQLAVHRFTGGGTTYVDTVSLPAVGDAVPFYPPVIGFPMPAVIPPAPIPAPFLAQASRVLYGGWRLWISDTFGAPPPSGGTGDWRSLPTNTATDRLASIPQAAPLPTLFEFITAITFLTFNRIVVGTSFGNCFLYERPGGVGPWIGQQSLALAGTWPLTTFPAAFAVVTDLCPDPTDATNRAFFASVGGNAGRRRVWRGQVTLNGAGNVTATAWSVRSGAGATQLLNVNHNAIVTDGNDLYVGADIGLWRSTDSGATWIPFADGLPDAAILDLELAPNRILRVSTHGRGTHERQLPAGPVPRVRLVVRETILDRGLRAAVYGGRDHLGVATVAAASPDILVDAPVAGAYQTSPNQGVDHIAFAGLTDRSGAVATHAAGVVNRVHVQVQNSGAEGCSGATVLVLLAEAVAGAPPALPADHVAAVRSGLLVTGGGWSTIGIRRLGALDASEPVIASFDLHSALLPTPSALAGHAAWYLLALVTHELDPFPDPAMGVQALADAYRHAALKAITVTVLPGTPPAVQGPPRVIPAALPLAVAIVADRRLAELARESRIRVVSGDHLHDTDHALNALVQAATAHLRAGPLLPANAAAATGLGQYVALGAIGLDLPDWADYLESRPGWMRTALRRGSADADVSATVADALTVVAKTGAYALLATSDVQQQARIRAFCAGMACAVAAEVVMGPVLQGIAAQRGPADPGAVGHADRAIAETWVSRVLLGGVPERAEFDAWFPQDSDLPPALLPAFAKALKEAISEDQAARRVATTSAPSYLATPDGDELAEGVALWQSTRAQSNWGMGNWFAALLPVFLFPSLGVLLSRFGDHSGRLLRITDATKGADDPANDSDEKSWYQTANFTLACGIPAPFAYNLVLWALVPRRDADFVQFTVAGGLRTVFAVVAAGTIGADAGLRWGLVFVPWIATDLYFLVRSIVHYAQGRPGSGLMHLIQVLPLMGLGVAWLFCLLIRIANLRKDEEFWPMWALFTGLLLGGGLVMAWRLAAGRGIVQMLRDRQDPVLGFDAFAGRDLIGLPAARAHVFAEHQLWSQAAGVPGERFPAGMRPVLKLWHGDAGWEIHPLSDRIELRKNGAAPIIVNLPKVQTSAQLLTSLTAAVAGLQGSVVDPAGFELPWPVRIATHGDDQPTWAAHDREAALWRPLGSNEGAAYLLRHAPRSRTAASVGAPTGQWSPAEGALRVVPDRDATDPLGTDLPGTALGRAGDLAALFQLALAPILTPSPGLMSPLLGVSTPLVVGREVLRRWNLDERREAEWRLLVGLDALPDQAAERLYPSVGAPSTAEAVTRLGMLPTLDAWGKALRDDRIDLDAERTSVAMPLVRPHGEAPRPVLHRELRDALKVLLNVP